jgi:hypothetical protein
MEPHVEVVESETPTIRTWCVVYDVATNAVVHTYEHLAFDADGSPNVEELARAALAVVASVSDTARLAVAYPAPGVELAPDFEYAVDSESAAVVAQPIVAEGLFLEDQLSGPPTSD